MIKYSTVFECNDKKKTVPIALTPANITKLKNITKLTKCRCKKQKNDLKINCHSILMKKLISKVPSKCECSGTYEKLYLWLYDQKT